MKADQVRPLPNTQYNSQHGRQDPPDSWQTTEKQLTDAKNDNNVTCGRFGAASHPAWVAGEREGGTRPAEMVQVQGRHATSTCPTPTSCKATS